MRFLRAFLLGGLLMGLGLGCSEEQGKPMKNMQPGKGEIKENLEMKVKNKKPEPAMDPAPQPPPEPAKSK
jgi:hypothetical protein